MYRLTWPRCSEHLAHFVGFHCCRDLVISRVPYYAIVMLKGRRSSDGRHHSDIVPVLDSFKHVSIFLRINVPRTAGNSTLWVCRTRVKPARRSAYSGQSPRQRRANNEGFVPVASVCRRRMICGREFVEDQVLCKMVVVKKHAARRGRNLSGLAVVVGA